MDFSWTEEQAAFRKEVIRFAKQELNDDLERRDRDEEFPREFWNKCAAFGIQGLPAPVEYGGGGADTLTTVCALEALGYGCKDNGFLFSLNAHLWTSVIPLMTFGTEEQKRKYLPRLTSGEWIGLHCMTEPMSGSDAYSLKTRAERNGHCYVLNGSKTFITNTVHGDLFVVFANVDPEKGPAGITAFLIEKGTPGLVVGNKLHKMGLRTSPMSEVALVDCEIPRDSILGKEGSGQAIFNHSMEWERTCIMASHLGMQQRLIETCVKYGRERQQFGAPIGKYSAIANKVADMEVRLETGRLLLYKAAWLKSQGRHALREASMAKLYVSETTVQTCLDAIQIHGGYGYMQEYEMERDLRDAISGKIYSGTSEIQKVIIAGFQGL
ncbi:MAG TPA: acyl-CoA dehydrogenase family protein [Candidatus Aquilonibacter sp.]|nr:acyl-CoA dehydrogenase family protein [Candidatus Aquilonibacter sp.]